MENKNYEKNNTFKELSGSFIIFALLTFVLSSRPLIKELGYIQLFIPLLSYAIVNIGYTVSKLCKLNIQDFTAKDEEDLTVLIVMLLLVFPYSAIFIISGVDTFMFGFLLNLYLFTFSVSLPLVVSPHPSRLELVLSFLGIFCTLLITIINL